MCAEEISLWEAAWWSLMLDIDPLQTLEIGACRARLGLDEEEIAEDVLEEFEENQEESWAAVTFACAHPWPSV